MKIAILAALLVVIILLLTILYMLFQPGPAYRAGRPSPSRMEAAVGRAVLQAAQSDPATATMVRAAVQAAPDEDRALASELIATFLQR
ncbi:hypothetical protein MKK75_08625 [Methylobacterium sp. J-030]|uniref:hypothetical protein n=1 Tax=Methylobacterium sp. J-030 TaxID=2836627 RepID=UPI001FB9D33D|nr:hypothetical protein [Methylobacterium sp. J-030]MCJ2068864.1 hypothetical protein [Methylobacterium sp. J-030]